MLLRTISSIKSIRFRTTSYLTLRNKNDMHMNDYQINQNCITSFIVLSNKISPNDLTIECMLENY